MRIEITDDAVELRLSWWQKVLGLMRDVRVPFNEIDGAELIANPVRVAGGAGLKFGLRLPLLYFVARTLNLQQAFVVRRGVPGVSVSVAGPGPLRQLLVSTPDAEQLVKRIEAARRR